MAWTELSWEETSQAERALGVRSRTILNWRRCISCIIVQTLLFNLFKACDPGNYLQEFQTRKTLGWLRLHNTLTADTLALQSILLSFSTNVTFISLRNSRHSSLSEKPSSGIMNSSGRVGRYLVWVKWGGQQTTTNSQ